MLYSSDLPVLKSILNTHAWLILFFHKWQYHNFSVNVNQFTGMTGIFGLNLNKEFFYIYIQINLIYLLLEK